MESVRERFSLKDHMFNAQTVGQLAQEYAAEIPLFGAANSKAKP